MKKLSLLLVLTAFSLLPLRAETIVALTNGNRLLSFDSTSPETIQRTVTVTGLAEGETLLEIDFRPATGGLYALGSSNRIYSIAQDTGRATAIGNAGTFTLTGTQFGFDFNPVVDRIRVTSDTDENLRINPDDGTTTTDSPLNYAKGDPNEAADPNVVAAAYTRANTADPVPVTALYGIDTHLEILVRQDPPNSGTLNSIGSLGVDVEDDASLDISPATGVAYAFLHPSPAPPPAIGTDGVPPPLVAPGLFIINLDNGQATNVGPIGNSETLGTESVISIAVPAAAQLLNLSTRGRVDNGENILIAGFIIRGFADQRFLLRAIGPSVTGVTNTLADPVLTLFDRNGTAIQTNDNWQDSDDAAAIAATGIPPNDPAESAILATLPPGAYTAQVSSADGTAGIALVEVYTLP